MGIVIGLNKNNASSAFFKLSPVFIFIIPGMICLALAKSGQNQVIANALLDAEGNLITTNAQQAFPLLVTNVLPVGIRGLVVAGLLAAYLYFSG